MAKAPETTAERDTVPLSIRLDAEIVQEIDRVQERERRGTRTDTVRALLLEALDARRGKSTK